MSTTFEDVSIESKPVVHTLVLKMRNDSKLPEGCKAGSREASPRGAPSSPHLTSPDDKRSPLSALGGNQWRLCIRCQKVHEAPDHFSHSDKVCNQCTASGPKAAGVPRNPSRPSSLSSSGRHLSAIFSEEVIKRSFGTAWRQCTACGTIKDALVAFREDDTLCRACTATEEPDSSGTPRSKSGSEEAKTNSGRKNSAPPHLPLDPKRTDAMPPVWRVCRQCGQIKDANVDFRSSLRRCDRCMVPAQCLSGRGPADGEVDKSGPPTPHSADRRASVLSTDNLAPADAALLDSGGGSARSHHRSNSTSQVDGALDASESPWRKCTKCGMVKDSHLSFSLSPIECNGCVRLAAGPQVQPPAVSVAALPPRPPPVMSVTLERPSSDSQGSRHEAVSPLFSPAADQWKRCALCGLMKEARLNFHGPAASCDACCGRSKQPGSPATPMPHTMTATPRSPVGPSNVSPNGSFASSGSSGWTTAKGNRAFSPAMPPSPRSMDPPAYTSCGVTSTNGTPRGPSPSPPPAAMVSSTHSSPAKTAPGAVRPNVSVVLDPQRSSPQAGSPKPAPTKTGPYWPTPMPQPGLTSPTTTSPTTPVDARPSSGPFRPLQVLMDAAEAGPQTQLDLSNIKRTSPPNAVQQWPTPRSGRGTPSSPVPTWTHLLPADSAWRDPSSLTPRVITPPPVVVSLKSLASDVAHGSPELGTDGDVASELRTHAAEDAKGQAENVAPAPPAAVRPAGLTFVPTPTYETPALPGWRTPRSRSVGAEPGGLAGHDRQPSYLGADKLAATACAPLKAEEAPSGYHFAPDYPQWQGSADPKAAANPKGGSSPTLPLARPPPSADAFALPAGAEALKETATPRLGDLPQGSLALWRKCGRCEVLKEALADFNGSFAMVCRECLGEPAKPPARAKPAPPTIPPLPLSPHLPPPADGSLSQRGSSGGQRSSGRPSPLPSPALTPSSTPSPKPPAGPKAGADHPADSKTSPRSGRAHKGTLPAASVDPQLKTRSTSPKPKRQHSGPEPSPKVTPKAAGRAVPSSPRPAPVAKAAAAAAGAAAAPPDPAAGAGWAGSPCFKGPAAWQVQQYRICTTCHHVKSEAEFSVSELDCMQCVAAAAARPTSRAFTPKRSPGPSAPSSVPAPTGTAWPQPEEEEEEQARVFSDGSTGDDEDVVDQLGRCSSAQRLRLFTKLEKRKLRRRKGPGSGRQSPPLAEVALRRVAGADTPPGGLQSHKALETPQAPRTSTPQGPVTPSPTLGCGGPASHPVSGEFNSSSSFYNSPHDRSSLYAFTAEVLDEFFQGLQVAWENLGNLPLTLRDLIMQLGSVPLVKANAAQPQLCRYCCKKMGTYISRVSFAFFSTDASWTCSDCYNAGLVYHSELPTDNKERLFFINIIHYCFKKAVSDNTMLLEFLDFIPFVYECNIRLKPDSFAAKLKETYRNRCLSGPGMTFDEMTECCAELKLKGLTKTNFRLFSEANERLSAHGFCKLLYALSRPKSPHLARMPLEEKQSITSLVPFSRPSMNSVELPQSSGEGIHDIRDFDYRKAHKLRVLGVGGMSIVWLIEFKGVNLAAKTPKPATKPEHVKLMFNAARLQQRVKHPNVLRVLGVFEDSEWPCILLEPIDGGSIADLCLSPVPVSLKWKLAAELAQGIDALHTAWPPIIHRDLKGSNVFLTSDHTVKIADFDFAVELREGRTKGSCGTPGFMAPELLAGAHYDQTADVFSFGSILYELFEEVFPFTKEVDFRREDLNQGDWDKIATMLTMEGMRPALSDKCPRCMRHLIRDCWAPKPEERPRPGTLCNLVKALPVPAD